MSDGREVVVYPKVTCLNCEAENDPNFGHCFICGYDTRPSEEVEDPVLLENEQREENELR